MRFCHCFLGIYAVQSREPSSLTDRPPRHNSSLRKDFLSSNPVASSDRTQSLVLRALQHVTIYGLMGERNPLAVGITLAGAIAVKPQDFLDPPPIGLDRAGGQSADLVGGCILIEELHVAQCPAQEMLGQFARSNPTHPDASAEIDMRWPSGILSAFDSENQKFGGGERSDFHLCFQRGIPMTHTPERCPKCNGAMVQGFIFEFDGALRKVSSWVEGAPEKSFWQNTKVPKEKIVPIGTYRCSVCGFLESYARDEFAAQ
jgi:hypothetical protein